MLSMVFFTIGGYYGEVRDSSPSVKNEDSTFAAMMHSVEFLAPILRAGSVCFMALPFQIPLSLPLRKGDFTEAEPRGVSIPEDGNEK
jgi:hypothetical protein